MNNTRRNFIKIVSGLIPACLLPKINNAAYALNNQQDFYKIYLDSSKKAVYMIYTSDIQNMEFKKDSRIIHKLSDCHKPYFRYVDFPIESVLYIKTNIYLYTFTGYKDSDDIVSEHSKDILRLKDKVYSLLDKIEYLEDSILDVLTKEHFTYSKEDLGV